MLRFIRFCAQQNDYIVISHKIDIISKLYA